MSGGIRARFRMLATALLFRIYISVSIELCGMAGRNGINSISPFFFDFQGSVARQRAFLRQVEGFGPK